MKVGSRGYCKYCGFAIHTAEIPTGKKFFAPFTRVAWVHQGDQLHCFWTAQPKSHTKPERTLHEQIADAKYGRYRL